jgi:uncharacterized protein (DUF433 family)
LTRVAVICIFCLQRLHKEICMSRVVSMRLKEAEADRLLRLSRRLRRSVSETAALLVSEKLREEEFVLIEFRSSPLGRQPYVKGTSLAVWEVVLLARQLGMDARRAAEHLAWPEERVQAALTYAEAYPEEVEPLVDKAEAVTFDQLKRRLPWLERVSV